MLIKTLYNSKQVGNVPVQQQTGGQTPPMTQNCSFLHYSSMLTPLHLSSRMPVAKIEMNRAMKKKHISTEDHHFLKHILTV